MPKNYQTQLTRESVKLDLRDEKILSILAKNSRAPISEISKKIHVNRDTIRYKIQRMQSLGVIQRFYAEIDVGFFHYLTCHVFIMVEHISEEQHLDLVQALSKHPSTRMVIEYNDRWDIEWVVIARTLQEFDAIVNNVASSYDSFSFEREKMVAINRYQTTYLPFHHFKEAGYELRVVSEGIKNIKMDRIDFEILRILSLDSRINAVDIGKRVGTSTDSAIRRIKKLVEKEIIRRFTIEVNRKKLNLHGYTLALNLRFFDQIHHSKFKEFIREHPFIIRAVKTLGQYDFLLNIYTNNPKNLHQTIKEIKKEFDDIIKRYEAWIMHKVHYCNHFPSVITLEDIQK